MARRHLWDMVLNESDSDNEEEELLVACIAQEHSREQEGSSRRRGSIHGHEIKHRQRELGHQRIYEDYFAENPTYDGHIFHRRFRMSRDLFIRIQRAVESQDSYFIQKRDAVGILGLSFLQKITAAFRMLAYGVSADSVDEYVQIAESTTLESLKKFVAAVIAIFGDEYLRSPNSNDIARLLEVNEERGFPGMLGSIDCMHWRWKNCPTAWHGMYTGHYREPTIILEAVASKDLWIWHAFFGLLRSHNDINVLDRSSVFTELLEGRAPPANYSINGHNYSMGYYLADGIYPPWATFVKTISQPQGNKNKHFATEQEKARKDVERAFGVLQSRFAIVRNPARLWGESTISDVMKACVIMHNMIVENERNREGNPVASDYDSVDETPFVLAPRTRTLQQFIETHHRIRNRQDHSTLQSDLVEHLWELHGGVH